MMEVMEVMEVRPNGSRADEGLSRRGPLVHVDKRGQGTELGTVAASSSPSYQTAGEGRETGRLSRASPFWRRPGRSAASAAGGPSAAAAAAAAGGSEMERCWSPNKGVFSVSRHPVEHAQVGRCRRR